jgi:ribose transport system ATP-binding protein
MRMSSFVRAWRMEVTVILELRDIRKSFGETEVLSGVNFAVRSGEVLALVGENGAGKSTLTRIISGAHRPDGGSIAIDGESVDLRRPQDAMARGIQVIYQEFLNNIFPHLSVAENLFTLDKAGRFGRMFVSKRRMRRDARVVISHIGLDVDPAATAETLSVAELQMLEIAKSTTENIRMLILDEPTAALDEQESERLFEQIDVLKKAGIAIIYISHRLEEVFRISDRIVVLRNGTVVLEKETAQSTEREIVAAMVGKTIDDLYPKENHTTSRVVLSLRSASSAGHFSDVSLDVRAGEVLGIGGVMGCGKGSVLRALFGLIPITTGEVILDGKLVRSTSPAAAIDSGIAYVPPDRQSEGLCLQQSISNNISLASLSRFSIAGIVRRKPEHHETQAVMSGLSIRAGSPDVEVAKLSGGNQQKVLFGRWVMARPKVLLMEEPTRGVDIGAKAEIYRIINAQAALGVAIILVSGDLPELVAMSDRVAVMRQGRVVIELEGTAITQQNLLEHALESAA